MITCPICHKQFNQLTNSHLKTHSHTTDSFRVAFPDIDLVSPEVQHKNRTNSAVGRELSSAANQQKFTDRMQDYGANPAVCAQCATPLSYVDRHNKFCSHNCAAIFNNKQRYESGWTHSEGTIQKLREKVLANPSGIYKQHLEGTWEPRHVAIKQPSEVIKRVTFGPHTKVRQCQVCNKTFATTTRTTCSTECYLLTRKGGGFQPNSTIVHRSTYKDQQMDSGAELAFAKLLDAHNVEWQKNSTMYFTFNYPTGKLGKYYPDFYLPKYNAWIEIKGKKYYRNDDPIRWAAVPNHECIFSHQLRLPAVCTGNAPVL